MRYLNFASSPMPNGHPASSLPERLIVAIDTSPSMEDSDWPPTRFEAAQEAAKALIKRKCEITPVDEVGLVSYADDAKVECPPVPVGRSERKLEAALRRMSIGSGTSISAALQAARTQLLPRSRTSWIRRALGVDEPVSDRQIPRLVILTDGHHNTGSSPRPIAKGMRDRGMCIDCIGIGGAPSDVDESLLKAIASTDHDGSKRYRFIGDGDELVRHFRTLADRITRA